jgi:cellobiose-specific phosphotransferase system component IIB
MKNLLLLSALILGTSVMVNAQTEPAKNTQTKEVKTSKHSKHHEKNEVKAPKMETSSVKK